MRILPINATGLLGSLLLGTLCIACWGNAVGLQSRYAESVQSPVYPFSRNKQAEEDQKQAQAPKPTPQEAKEDVQVTEEDQVQPEEDSDNEAGLTVTVAEPLPRVPLAGPNAETIHDVIPKSPHRIADEKAREINPQAQPSKQKWMWLEFRQAGVPTLLSVGQIWLVIAGAAGLAGACVGVMRNPLGLRLIRIGCLAGYLTWVGWAGAVFFLTGVLADQTINWQGQDLGDRGIALWTFWWRVDLLGWPTVGLCLLVWLHVLAWRRDTINAWSGQPEAARLGPDEPTFAGQLDAQHPDAQPPAVGDVILEDARTHGDEPRYRKSVYASLLSHFLAIFGPIILAWLLSFWGCMQAYKIPKGDTAPPVVQVVQVVQPKKKKKKLIVNPQSAIIFEVPELDDSEMEKVVEENTKATRQADPSRVIGEEGQGEKGGWPDGMEDALVRFIYLKHNGSYWNDGFNDGSNAARNFLEFFRAETGFETKLTPEVNAPWQLLRYPEGFAPPFVYLTGDGPIRMSQSDMEKVRKYVMDGGMIVADASTLSFHRSFTNFARRLFPHHPMRDIADDDPLYAHPYPFRNGAPPLAAHGGQQAMGVKIDGRWVIYYHSGDLNDAWKDLPAYDSRSVEKAYKLGVNLISYSFTNYLRETRHLRTGN